VESSCESGNEPSGSLKCCVFLKHPVYYITCETSGKMTKWFHQMVFTNQMIWRAERPCNCYFRLRNILGIADKTQLRGLSPRAKYTDRATDCRRSYCQLLWIEGAAWSARRIPTAILSAF
jgi:hypothetical protein